MPPTVTPLFRTRAAAVALLVGLSAAVAVGSLTPVSAHSAIAASAARRAVNNLLHLPVYAALTLAWAWALSVLAGVPAVRRGAVAAGAIAVLYGVAMELCQLAVPGRTASVGDALLNASGAGAAAGALVLLARGRVRPPGGHLTGALPHETRACRTLAVGPGLVRGLMRHEGSVSQKAVRSAFWVMAGMAFSRLLDLVNTVILVRLLVSADFGLMRTAGIVIAAVLTFTETGAGMAVVQRKDLDDETLNTAWTMQVIRNTLLYGVVWFLAPAAARFYDNPVITPILRLVGIGFVCSGFGNISMMLLRRELDFRTTEIYQVIVETLGVAVTIVAAFILHNVWALAIGQVVFAFIKLIGSYVIHPYRPRFAWSGRQARALLSFGLNMTASGILFFFCSQADSAVVGKIAGMAGLGFYSLALSLSNLPVNCISGVLNAVAFPIYAKLQKSPEYLRAAMAQVLWVVTLLAVPASVGLYLLAPALVAVVYGPKYMPMVACFRVLVAFGLTQALVQVTRPATVAMGKPRLELVGYALRSVIMGALIYPATVQWGISGAAAAAVLSILVQGVWAFWQAERLCGGGLVAKWLPELAHSTAAAAAMGLPVYLLVKWGVADSPAGLVAVTALGVVVYFGVALATGRQLYGRVKKIATSVAVK